MHHFPSLTNPTIYLFVACQNMHHVDKLEDPMWRDKIKLKKIKESSCQAKENVNTAKQQQSQEQVRRKRAQDGIISKSHL